LKKPFLIFFASLLLIGQDSLSFQHGEKLLFDVSFRFISAGVMTMEILLSDSGWVITSETRSTGILNKLYPVRDKIISKIHRDSLFTLEYEKDISEGKYKRKYHANIHYSEEIIHSSAGDVPVSAPVYDLLAVIYYLRNTELAVGKEFSLRCFDNNKVFPITMKVVEQKNIQTKLGKLPCYILKPSQLNLDKKSKLKGGLEVWISATPARLPVMIKSQLLWGSMDATLVDIL